MMDIFMNSKKEHYNEYAKFYAEHHIEELKRCETGLFILCEAKEDNSTRLFIHRFSHLDDILKKDGWWDIFTITETPCKEKGFYICKINDFRIDKNGFLNALVSSEHYLGINIELNTDAWRYFFVSGLFTSRYRSSMDYPKTRFNINALHQLYKDDMERIELEKKEQLGDHFLSVFKEKAEFIMNKYFNGEITLEEIDHALDEKEEIEILVEDLNRNVSRYGSDPKNLYVSEYPLLVKKLPTVKSGFLEGCYTTQNSMEYLERKNIEYATLGLGDEEKFLVRVEAVLQYWVDIKTKEKEEKKLKRKAQKTLAAS